MVEDKNIHRRPIFEKFAITGNLEIIVSDIACVSMDLAQIRFPKSKKKRIRKKWKKNLNNWDYKATHRCVKIDNKLYVSSKVFEMIKASPFIQQK